jgi:hypothetical protein
MDRQRTKRRQAEDSIAVDGEKRRDTLFVELTVQ